MCAQCVLPSAARSKKAPGLDVLEETNQLRCTRNGPTHAAQHTGEQSIVHNNVHSVTGRLFAGHWPVSALPSKRRARLNTCHSCPVRASCTRCRCFYVYVLVSLSHHKDDLPQYLLLLPSSCSGRASLVVICQDQDTSRGVPSQDRHRSKLCAYGR